MLGPEVIEHKCKAIGGDKSKHEHGKESEEKQGDRIFLETAFFGNGFFWKSSFFGSKKSRFQKKPFSKKSRLKKTDNQKMWDLRNLVDISTSGNRTYFVDVFVLSIRI